MTEKEKVQGFSIKDKSACIIGCGGLGCNIAVHLIGSGIGRLYLCDFDTVSSSNLNRQFLYTKEDIGKSKCLKAKERLLRFSEDTEIITVERKITSSENMAFARDCDIVILAVDNAECRKVVQSFCIEENKALVCGGIDGFYGMCYLYVPKKSPCPDCAGMNSGEKAQYNISATAGVIGSLQSALVIKYLLTKDSNLSGKMLIFDNCDFDALKISPSSDCKICKDYKK